ncbi:restriction endonuclease subunit S [Methanobrevibacter sp.]
MSYEYIDTDVEYIGTIPKTWDLVRNKHLFNKTKVIVGPNWDKYNVLSLTKKGVIIKDIENNQGKMPSDFSIYQLVNPGNLLMCLFDIDVTPRCVGYIENKGIVSAAYTELAPVEEIDMKYYYWWYLMLDIDKQLLHLSKNLRNSLSTEDFMALSVVKPPIKEQQQIANYLDKQTAKIDATIAKNEELIELLEEKRVALINQVVTKGLNPDVPMKDSGIEWIGEIPEHWDVTLARRFCKIETGGTPKREVLSYWENGTVNWMTSGEVNQEYVNDTKNKITVEGLNNSNAHTLPKHSIVMALSGQGQTKGRVAILNIPTCCSQSVGAFICDNIHIYYKYLFYYFKSRYYDIRGLVGDNLRDGLSLSIIGDIPTLMPPFEEQIRLANELDKHIPKINQIIDKITDNITLLEEYKTSLIHHVVTGKIDVRGEEI